MDLILPVSKQQVTIRPMQGLEEKLLLDKILIKQGKNMDEIFRRCITHVDGEILSATDPKSEKVVLDWVIGDRNFILFHLRILSYGPLLEVDHSCSQCKKKINEEINLEEYMENDGFEILMPPEDMTFTKEVEVSGGMKVVICPFDGHRQRRLSTTKDLDIIAVTMGTMLSIDGENVTRGKVEKMPAKDLLKIRQESNKNTYGLNPEIIVECNECGTENKINIGSLASFFVPK